MSLPFIKSKAKSLKNFSLLHQNLQLVVVMIDDLVAGCVPLRDVVSCSRKRSFKDFQIFLKALEVYGFGYFDDVNRSKSPNRADLSHC